MNGARLFFLFIQSVFLWALLLNGPFEALLKQRLHPLKRNLAEQEKAHLHLIFRTDVQIYSLTPWLIRAQSNRRLRLPTPRVFAQLRRLTFSRLHCCTLHVANMACVCVLHTVFTCRQVSFRMSAGSYSRGSRATTFIPCNNLSILF